MSFRSVLLCAAVVTAVVTTTRADLATCGRWHTTSTCEIADSDPFDGGFNGSLQFMGTVAGSMYLDFYHYSDTACNQSLLWAHAAGTFNDLGPVSENLQFMRKFAINLTMAYVRPESDDGADAMAGICPCADPGSPSPWRNGDMHDLQSCNNCDISFLGGTNIAFNQPSFVIVNISADGGFTIGQMDMDPSIGFTNPAHLTYPTADAECVTTGTANLCGAFTLNNENVNDDVPCEILLDPWTNAIVGSRKATFKFRGPPSDVVIIDQYGVYMRESTYFSDANCSVIEATVDEEGSMGNFGRDGTSGLDVVSKAPASFAVVPATTARGWATVANLTQKCSCGGAPWRAGNYRTITTCPEGSCVAPIFNDFNTPGYALYAFVARNITTLDDETSDILAFGSWNTSLDRLDSSGLKYAMAASTTMQDYCDAGSYTATLCGTYSTECSNDRTGYDTIKEITLSGITTNASSEGKITFAQTLFNNTGNGCMQTDALYLIKGTGYFSQDSFATTPDVVGLASVDVDFTAVDITPMSQGATDSINRQSDGCPCNGTWVTGQKRTLFYCPAGSCSPAWMWGVLPGGEFGQPGYGVMQLNTVDLVLRLSELDTAMAEGYSNGFDAQTTLLRRSSECPTATHPADFRGCWDLPCYRVDAGTSSYAMSGVFDSTGTDDASTGLFFFNRSVYNANSGCAQTGTQLVAIDAEGGFTRASTSRKVVGGSVVSLDIYYVTVTPLNAAGAEVLTAECRACNMNWQAGVAVTFTDTPCECAFLTTLAGIPLQKGLAHGVTKVWDYSGSDSAIDDAFRMTTFSRSVESVNSVTLTRANGEYAKIPDGACRFAPQTGPSSNNGSGGLQGGDIFILLLVVSLTVYFFGGMVMNYQRTGGMKNGGTPVIPHITFWRALPGLVSDGFRFVFVDRFGTASGRAASYSTFGGASDGSNAGGYGAL